MQIDDFQMMVILAQELNMRKASERLFVSQPALSQRLQSMEKQWGMKFFIRSQKGLTITPEGEKVANYAKDMLQREEAIKSELATFQTETYGTLKLAVASVIGQYWLPPVLKMFVQRYPFVKISLFTGWSSEVQNHFYEGDVHVAILRGKQEYKGYKQQLFEDELYLVDTEIKDISMLKDTNKPFIQFKSDSTYYGQIQNWWYGLFSNPPKRTIVVDQIETCKKLVLNGIGYALLPSTVLKEVKEKTYKTPVKLTRETWLLTSESARQLKQVQAFLDIIEEIQAGK
ncbi:LysR family transcriptional regulator [Bacillus pseudomycoides]|nr:LysR family transcriptional regulator [Bacillus pseudomycoides]